jgi:carotenoid cleavage dioxygenase-like enzyme
LLQWTHKAENPFLSGTMAPVNTEVFTMDLKVVEGAIPPDMSGVFLRTGPNPQHQPWGGYHWSASRFANTILHVVSFSVVSTS